MTTLLTIPCFRESRRLPVFLAELCAALRGEETEILVVDDGSGAEEAAALQTAVESLRAAHPHLRPLLELPENLGKGGAVYAGWQSAEPTTQWLAFVDADGSCSAKETLRLLRLARGQPASLSGYEASTKPPALIASRVKMLGRRVDRQWRRHLIGRVYATLVSELLDIPVYDSQCGLKVVPREAYEAVRPHLSVPGFAFDVDLIRALLRHGTPVLEIPIDWFEVPGGKVRLLRDPWRMARDIWKIRQRG